MNVKQVIQAVSSPTKKNLVLRAIKSLRPADKALLVKGRVVGRLFPFQVFIQMIDHVDCVDTLKAMEVPDFNIFDLVNQDDISFLADITRCLTVFRFNQYTSDAIGYIASRVSDINDLGTPPSYSALHWAVIGRSLPLIQIFLEHGADPLIYADDGRNCDDIAESDRITNPDFFRAYLAIKNACSLSALTRTQTRRVSL